MNRAAGAVVLVLAGLAAGTSARAGAGRTWEVNGIRLEAAQVERLADDIARQTVAAVRKLEGIALRDDQALALEAIYREVALDVYDRAVRVVARDDLADPTKEKRVRDLVLEGQERSTRRVARVLDTDQYERYHRWEEKQVAAFRARGLWSSGRRRSRGRR